MPPRPSARLVPSPRDGLPPWCDRFLEDGATGDIFASRLWYEVMIAHALPPDAEPLLAATDAVLLPLRRDRGRVTSLVTDYSVVWKPLFAPDAGADALRAAGAMLGRAVRLGPPVRLEALDGEQAGLAPLLDGLRAARIIPLRFASFGNWHETLPPGKCWEDYLAERPAALRNTIARKLARAERNFAWELVSAPGPELEAGIAAYVVVRSASWKPHEPFPHFDAALLRALAAAGALRLGLLREAASGRAVAAQYWVLDRGGAARGRRATVLKLAHDAAARSASPGTVLTALMIRHLIEQDAVADLDFGRGDDAYKRLWVARRRGRVGYVLADPLHPLGLAAMARQTASRLRRRLRESGQAHGDTRPPYVSWQQPDRTGEAAMARWRADPAGRGRLVSSVAFARWLPTYLREFGALDGMRLWLASALLDASQDSTPRALRLPGLARPAWLRPAAKDLAIFQQVFVKREYDLPEAVQYRHVETTYRDMLRRNERPLIIDCGAHVGFSALWFRRAFPDALIFAVEPNPENAAMFRRNLDGEAGVTLFEGGIWNQPGRLRLTDAAAGMAGRRAIPAGDSAPGDVPAITVEEILERTGSARALIVKVDIEGGEQALFDGETPWLDRVGMLVIELHDWLHPWEGTSDSFFEQISRRRFDRLFRGENMFCFRRPGTDEEGPR